MPRFITEYSTGRKRWAGEDIVVDSWEEAERVASQRRPTEKVSGILAITIDANEDMSYGDDAFVVEYDEETGEVIDCGAIEDLRRKWEENEDEGIT